MPSPSKETLRKLSRDPPIDDFFIFKVQVSANPIVKNKINIIRQPSVDLTEPNLLVNSFKSKAGEALLDLFWDYTPFKK